MRVRFRITGSILALLLIGSGCAYHSNFTDRSLEERFRSHEAEFSRLVQMLKEDSEVSRVNNEGAYKANDIKATPSANRLEDYRGLLSKLDLISIFRDSGTDKIYFALWNKADWFMGGTNEYFVYAETPPAEEQYLVESLDKLRTQTDAFAFKKITDRWYLHVDNW
ncbi:MAG: hypothetical protein ND895_27295 [Pyrinomonadaceae bacterium]|nr:hypothetical protein [Pyrinomonadaceae bacterium]